MRTDFLLCLLLIFQYVYSAPRPDPPENLEGVVQGFATAVSWGPGRLDVFARGTDNAMWHRWKDNGPWAPWESLGGVIFQSPSCVSWGPNRIDCFVVGGGGAMFHKWWDGRRWNGWENRGGVITDAISCTARRERAIDCFARGTDMALFKMSWTDGTGWTGWVKLGNARLDSAPACVAKQPDAIHCFYRGNDNNLKEKTLQMNDDGTVANGDGEWTDLGGDINETPSAVYLEGGKIEVMVRGRHMRMKRRFHADGRWHGWQDTSIHLDQPVAAVRERGTRNIHYFLINDRGNVVYSTLQLLE